jgi:hypothetical protein
MEEIKLDIPKGNCFRRSIAELLHVELYEVPRFEVLHGESDGYAQWYLCLQNWLKKRNLCFVECVLPENVPWFPQPHNPFCILFGLTKNGIKHAQVGRVEGKEFICVDPPDIVSVESIGFLVPIDPSKPTRFSLMLHNGSSKS